MNTSTVTPTTISTGLPRFLLDTYFAGLQLPRIIVQTFRIDTGRIVSEADSLIQIVDAAVADAYRRGGTHLVCRPGCSQCCIGVFPIAHEDGARLREGLALLETTDPQRAARIRTRVQQSLTHLDPWFPGD